MSFTPLILNFTTNSRSRSTEPISPHPRITLRPGARRLKLAQIIHDGSSQNRAAGLQDRREIKWRPPPNAVDGRRCLVCLMSRTLPRHPCLDSAENENLYPPPRTATTHTSYGPRAAHEPLRHYLRDEAKKVAARCEPQPRKNRRCTRRNTLRIFQGRERHRWLRIIRHRRTVSVGQAPRHRNTGHTRTDAAVTAWDLLPYCVCSRSRPRSGPC